MTSDSEPLRGEVRSWLEKNVPVAWREMMTGTDQEAFLKLQRDFFLKLVDAGYATPHWPSEWPGGGRSLAEQKVIFEEIARADAPRLILFFVAVYHAAATLFECGSPEQQNRYVPGILKGDVWCQGFSEPNAGSDLASLRTRAELRGDRYIINGQKTWSTMAHHADYCLLLVRTDHSGPPRAGITYVLLNMRAKGVTVRPIRQITGDDEFAEIFLDDVEVPVEDRIGPEGEGWAVAQATLASERGLTLVEMTHRMRSALRLVSELVKEKACPAHAATQQLGKLVVRVNAACALAEAYLSRRIAGDERPGDASVLKLYYSGVLREFTALGLRMSGLDGQYWQPFTRGGGQETGNWAVDFMNSYNWSIAGGADEIQRNIVAERLLSMPREPKEWRLG